MRHLNAYSSVQVQGAADCPILQKNKLLESNQVFLIRRSSRVPIHASQSVGKVLHPHLLLPPIMFLV